MNFDFRPELTVEVKSYAANTPEGTGDILDCSLGVNPYGYPEAAAEALKNIDFHMQDYPHSKVLFGALCDYWKDFSDVSEDELFFVNGSVSGLYCLNNIFAQSKRIEVLGFLPSFTDMIESVRNFGMHYTGVPTRLSENGKQCCDDLIAELKEDTALVYIDRPNNPTGQTMSLEDVAKIAAAALDNGSYLLVDEAYGDFIPRDESAITLKNKYENIIVIKTFSKGFGLANLRGGYVVAPKNVTAMLIRTSNPYVLSDLHRNVFAAALGYPEHTTGHSEEFAAVKEAIAGCIGKRIKMLVTDGRVPICTLELQEPGDLQALLMKHGVLTVSGREFDLLDERYVRLRVPTTEYADRLVRAVSLVEQGQ